MCSRLLGDCGLARFSIKNGTGPSTGHFSVIHSRPKQNRTVENDGEYGVMTKKSKFKALTNFILGVDGYVEENEEVTGFLIRAKPKNNRVGTNSNTESGW